MGKATKVGIGVGIAITGFFIFAIVVGSQIGIEKEKEVRSLSQVELQTMAVQWSYDDILRNPEKYQGKIIRFDGEIFRAETLGEDHYALTVWIDADDYGTDTIIVDYTGSRVLDGDNILVYGEVERVVELGSMFASDWKNPYPVVKAVKLQCLNC